MKNRKLNQLLTSLPLFLFPLVFLPPAVPVLVLFLLLSLSLVLPAVILLPVFLPVHYSHLHLHLKIQYHFPHSSPVPEFIGRLPIIFTLDGLNEDML